MSRGWPKGKPRGKTWIKGLTKETDARVQDISRKLTGKIISDETRQKMSSHALQPKSIRQAIRNLPKPMAGEENPSYKGGFEKPCAMCGKPIWVMPYQKETKKYCSYKCYGEAKAETTRGSGNSFYGKHHSNSTIRKILKALAQKPNRREQELLTILNKYFPKEWKFVGDGTVIFGRLCPDFINCNGKKLIIELFGDHWHTGEGIPWGKTEVGRTMAFAEYGYKTLIIWGHDMNTLSEGELARKVEMFSNE